MSDVWETPSPTLDCAVRLNRHTCLTVGDDMLDAFIDFEFAARRDEFKAALAQRRENIRREQASFLGGSNE